ncbi:MAG: Ig-like domain-containing protein [Methanoregula sp.]|uniref:Ig-like domain-containing protein n=1 Tax=Methanoregula sp. TaxID=2052170 RepID=UPI003C62C5D6
MFEDVIPPFEERGDMRVFLLILFIAGLMCLIGGAAADDLSNSTITSTQAWVIANGNSQSTITVTAVNSNGINQIGIPVTFSLDPSSAGMGTLSPSSSNTNSNGVASATFTANKKSGNATIDIALTYKGNLTNLVYVQQIDHDVPFYWTVTSPLQATVGTETWFNVSYTDQWGNVIDHRNPADPDAILLQIGSVSGNAAFDINGNYSTSTTRQLDEQGVLSVKVLLDYIAGQNNIHLQTFGAIPDEYPSILGIANGVPASITQTTSPSPPDVPADMAHTVSLEYVLYDKYGNPTIGQNISVQTSAGDYYPALTSNQVGQVGLTYGPRGTAGNITLTATAAANSSVTCSENVTFYSTAPVNWALAADPQIMPSLDANNLTVANITAQVMDVMGNPVAGQTVTFSLGAPSYDKTSDIVTSAPKLTGTSAVTDSNGNAIVQFIPGGFSTNSSMMYYNAMATGNCSVTGTWNGTQQSVLLTWKNYPYLSAYTSVSPSTIPVNGTVTVTVKLTGDGWALTPNPIDVVLLVDRSGSMGDKMGDGNTEMKDAQTGAKTFVTMMNSSNDRIAVVSFSGDSNNNNNVDTTINSPLTTNAAAINAAITSLSPTSATGTRDGLYQSIALLNNNPNPNPKAVRAVILLTDGDYNWLGDPLGRGTGYYPAPPTGYTSYNTGNLEPNKYLYYNGLGGNFIPQANFIGTTTGTTRQVQFTDNSIGTPTSWYWNFGDGNTSTSQNPTNIYPYSSSTQYYTVSEKVTNAAGNTTITESNYVKISSNSITVQTKSSNPPTYTIAPDEQFTEQNMTNFAAANNIRLYMIAYANANNMNSQAISDMNVMANGTGGFYAAAPNAATLAQIYTNIAGQLQTAAGVNTQMNLNFQSVNVTGVTVPGADALSYVAANPGSTDITWQDGVTNNTDQSGQWPNLIFNIGTINLGQTWQATFQLRVLEGGSIQLFGNQSTITFNNGTSSMQLPPAYITSLANLTNTGVTTQSILLSPLLLTQSGIITDFVPLQWSTTYPGAQTAMERLYYSTSYQEPQTCGASPWVGPFDTQTGILPGGSSETSSLDVRTLPPGTYYICVLAQAPDALSATAETGSGAQVKMSGKSYIRLE